MDRFIRKVNQKINLPDDACRDFAFLKHGLLKVRITDLVGMEFNFPVNTILGHVNLLTLFLGRFSSLSGHILKPVLRFYDK